MGDSPSAGEQRDYFAEEMMELMEWNKGLERMIEDVEMMSVQLTWMAYDTVEQRDYFAEEMKAWKDLRTIELEMISVQLTWMAYDLVRLEKEYLHCKAAISDSPGEQGQEKEIKECPEPVDPISTPLT